MLNSVQDQTAVNQKSDVKKALAKAEAAAASAVPKKGQTEL